MSTTLYPRPWIQGLGARILEPGSRIQDPASWTVDPGSWIQGLGPMILEPGSRIQDTASWTVYPGSWIQGPGSSTLDFGFKQFIQWFVFQFELRGGRVEVGVFPP